VRIRQQSLIAALPRTRAESLGLSVRSLKEERLRLGRRIRKKSYALDGKPEAFRTGGGIAVYQSQSFTNDQRASDILVKSVL